MAAPIDPQGGGTWIAVNSRGLVVTLLNGYGDPRDLDGVDLLSRGLVVSKLAGCATLAEVAQSFESEITPDLRRYRAFCLLAVELDDSGEPRSRCFRWNGSELRREFLPKSFAESSSSFASIRARELRLRQLEPLLSNSKSLSMGQVQEVFSSHLPERGPYSICVHREDAATVSHTFVEVSLDSVRLRYLDAPLCEEGREYEVGLELYKMAPAPV